MLLIFLRKYRVLIAIYLIVCLGLGTGLAVLETQSAFKANTILTPLDSKTGIPAIEAEKFPAPPADIDANLKIQTTAKSADSKYLSILLLGYGGAGHDGGYLTDAIILAYLDLVKHKLAFIHIPRDIWLKIKVGETDMPMKINGVLAMGTKTQNYPTTTVSTDSVLRASSLSKQGVSTITGLPVDFIIGADFYSFGQAINTLKGIEVDVPAVFDDPWYPKKGFELELCGHSPESVTAMSATMSGFTLEKQFPCRYEHLHFEPGTVHMDGETALKYSRSRHTSSDYARGIRQISVIEAIIKKLFSLNALDKFDDFYAGLTKAIKTDISMDQLEVIVPILKTIPDLEIVEIGLDTTNVLNSGKSNNGAFILIPKDGEDNWEATHSLIQSKI